jgi:molybdopterin converting factor small subunit
MPILKIPTPMRSYVNGLTELSVAGGTVGAAVQSLLEQYPALRPHLTNSRGDLRPFVNLFLGSDNVKDMPQGLNTPLAETDTILILPSVAGG